MKGWPVIIVKSFVAVALGGLALSTPALASASADTTTVHFTFADPPAPDVNPCTGAPGLFSDSGKGVFHITAKPDGTFHETSTVVGNFLFEQNDGVTFTGKMTVWDGENVNHRNATFTATAHFTAFGSDGSKLSEHAVMHITLNANGTVTATVDKDTLRCG
jgi:hypothetical protein